MPLQASDHRHICDGEVPLVTAKSRPYPLFVGKVAHAEFDVCPQWHRTGSAYFPTAARVNGEWWVLRVNSFPDHPMWTLFVCGKRRFDLDDVPPVWGRPADQDLPLLDAPQAEAARAHVENFVAYGSEVGQPCDGPFGCG